MSWESGKYKKEGSIGVETDLKLAFSHHAGGEAEGSNVGSFPGQQMMIMLK